MKFKFCLIAFLFSCFESSFSQSNPPTLLYAVQKDNSKPDIYDASVRKILGGIDWAYSNAWT